MRQFDVYRLDRAGYVVILQSDLRSGGTTRVVAPVVPIRQISSPITGTDIRVTVGGEDCIIPMDLMSSMRTNRLDPEPVANLSEHHERFIRAIDLVFLGF